VESPRGEEACPDPLRGAGNNPAAGVRQVPGRAQTVKTDLVGRQIEKRACLVGVHAVIVAETFDPEFRAQVPLRQRKHGGRKLIIHHQPQLVFPAAHAAEGVELMLFENVCSKAI
jgi:hypothetical protein